MFIRKVLLFQIPFFYVQCIKLILNEIVHFFFLYKIHLLVT